MTGLLQANGIDLDKLNKDQVRYGVVVNLPFRIRVGALTRVSPPDIPEYEVWLYNSTPIPPGSHLPAILHALPNRDRDGYRDLWTQAVVVISSPKLKNETIAALKNGDVSLLGLEGNMFRALTSLNEVVFGCTEAIGSPLGGRPLRLLTDTDFFQAMRLEFGFLLPAGQDISEEDVREILEWRPEKEIRSLGQLTGELTDLPAADFASVPQQIAKYREHAYHELAFRAKMAMFDRDPFVALVLACAALEGAHAALLHRNLFPALSDGQKKPEELIENLLREQGISTMLELTPYAFMNEKHRPSHDAISRCLKAFTMRNGIVHAKQKKGTYRIREHTFMELSDAYSTVLTMFQTYVAALT